MCYWLHRILCIQRPSLPTSQRRTWSSYKSHNTFKCLIPVTQRGSFSFVSHLWTGSISDRRLVERCGFLELLEPEDDVMADSSFVTCWPCEVQRWIFLRLRVASNSLHRQQQKPAELQEPEFALKEPLVAWSSSQFCRASFPVAYLGFGKGGYGERAEREPITVVWGGAPSGVQGQRPWSGGQGGEAPLKLKHFLLLNVQWKPQIRSFFWNLETQKTIKHCWILQFLLEIGKKPTFSYKVAFKKFSWSGQRGGIAPWPSP